MTVPAPADGDRLESRARQSLGSSSGVIYRMVAEALRARELAGGSLVDVGCGGGALWSVLRGVFSSYLGLDAVRYDAFPADAEFRPIDLDRGDWPIDSGLADVVVAVETIEHLENPWAFMRGLVRIAKPGGWIVVTTPNQLSALSLMCLLVTQRFVSFQDVSYPAHRTALLEADLRRIAAECRLERVDIAYTHHGRVPLVPWHYPRWLARRFPRVLSDNLMVIGWKPAG